VSDPRWDFLDAVPPTHLVVVRAGVLDRVLDATHPRPVAAVAPLPRAGLGEVLAMAPAPFLVVVLAGLADPGNVGTVIRSAAAAGATAVVLAPDAADPFGPKAVRASAGAILHVPVVTMEIARALPRLAAVGCTCWSAVGDAATPLDEADLTGSTALVFGTEAHGLTADLQAGIPSSLRVPMAAGTESLNVAMAATVVLFEAARQRRMGGPKR